jgi:hypothetical protein
VRWLYRILASQYLPRQIGRSGLTAARSIAAHESPGDHARQRRQGTDRGTLDGGLDLSAVASENLSSQIDGPDLEHG